MTERLDRIEALLESAGEKLDRTTEKQAKNTEDIDTLLGAIAATEASVQNLTAKATDTDQLFETLRAEAQADRQETRQMWNDAITQMEIDRSESSEKFDRAMAQMDADRSRAEERHTAQMEVIQTLLIELTKSNGNINTLRDRVDRLEAS